MSTTQQQLREQKQLREQQELQEYCKAHAPSTHRRQSREHKAQVERHFYKERAIKLEKENEKLKERLSIMKAMAGTHIQDMNEIHDDYRTIIVKLKEEIKVLKSYRDHFRQCYEKEQEKSRGAVYVDGKLIVDYDGEIHGHN